MGYGKLFGGDITQHENYAITGKTAQGGPGSPSFGVQMHDHKNKQHKNPKETRGVAMKDHKRGIRKTDGYHAEPDHGPTESMAD